MDRQGSPGDRFERQGAPRRRGVAVAAVALAAAYLVAASAVPAALPLVAVAAVAGCCALVLARRRSHALTLVLAVVPVWLGAGLGGALLLQNRVVEGFGWVAIVLFVAPLPVIPWLYARTFRAARPLGRPRRPGAGSP